MNKIEVQGVSITLDETYVSLTDIAKQNSDQRPDTVISSWLKNRSTLLFLKEWETINNPNFKPSQMTGFMLHVADNRYKASPKRFVKDTDAIGLYTKSGRNGGTYAHPDVAISFCYWLSPTFAVWMIKTFQELLLQEFEKASLQWHISKITDNIDEVRNLLDSIPHQNSERDRRKFLK